MTREVGNDGKLLLQIKELGQGREGWQRQSLEHLYQDKEELDLLSGRERGRSENQMASCAALVGASS